MDEEISEVLVEKKVIYERCSAPMITQWVTVGLMVGFVLTWVMK
jgi:hypothetical protein